MDIEEILKALNANASQGRKASAIHRVISNDLRWHVEHGDSLAVLRSMPDACVDAIVTDPPAGIGFMGKEFDSNRGGRGRWIAWLSERLAECYRVTKPGGRMLCWSIPRTTHWTGCAIEDAGWEIENTIAHLFGSGFPKAKTQLKPAREDWWLARKPAKNVLPLNIDECRVATNDNLNGGAYAAHGGRDILPGDEREGASLGMLAPGRTTGREFVQPSGRWPANLALSHFDGCVCVGTKRVKATSIHGDDVAVRRSGVHAEAGGHQTIGREQPVSGYADADGRETVEDWRCVEGCPIAELDRQSGDRKGSPLEWKSNGQRNGVSLNAAHDGSMTTPAVFQGYGDSGGASRFFNTFGVDRDDIDTALFVYQAKASRADRESMVDRENMVDREKKDIYGDGINSATKVRTDKQATNGVNRGGVKNNHPTVKSTPLMRHLVKLIAKPGDVVLDAFCGSGSTGRGAVLEGCRFIGIEREDTEAEPYVTIARRRIADATKTQ